MRFGEAIRTVYLSKYADFRGRATRSEMWYAFLFLVLITIGFYLLFMLLGGYNWMAHNFSAVINNSYDFVAPSGGILFVALIYSIFIIAIILPVFAVSTRRFHDVGLSGWWFAAIIAIRIFGILLPYPVNVTIIAIVGFIYVVICVWRGQNKANRYGSNPYK